MDREHRVEEVNPELATAFGLYALSDARIHEAAAEAGVTRWELERAIEDAGLAETFGLDRDGDVSGTLDELLDGA
jgi:hypothetical protein